MLFARQLCLLNFHNIFAASPSFPIRYNFGQNLNVSMG